MNEILNLIPTMQSISLLSNNIPKKKKGIIKQGVENIVGINLIGATANSIKF